jgi:hypothetical protein
MPFSSTKNARSNNSRQTILIEVTTTITKYISLPKENKIRLNNLVRYLKINQLGKLTYFVF